MNMHNLHSGADAARADWEDVVIFPASFAQRRLWLIDQLEPGTSTYNIPIALQLTGTLDVGALRASLTYLVERHEALRTVFEATDGEPMQVIREPAEFPLPHRAVTDAEIEDALRVEANRPFDLARGPVVRAALFALEPTKHVLLLVVHHIAADGWSIGLIVRELIVAYNAFSAGGSPRLAALPTQYADYAVWQREWIAGGALDAQLDYWRQTLAAPLPILELPGEGRAVSDREHRAESVAVTIDAATSDRVRELARDCSATPFMLLLAVFHLLLARLSGQDDVVVGTPIAGRTRREMEGVVGFFVNTLALRARVSHGATFREMLLRTRETTLAAFANADVPFEQLVEVVQPERHRSRNPIFQALFSLQDLGALGDLTMRGLQVTRVRTTREAAKFDLQLMLSGTTGAFRGTLEFDASQLEPEIATQLAASYVALVGQVVAAPDRPLDTLAVMDAAEWERTLAASAGPALDAPTATLNSLFRAQASATPDAVAIRAGNETVSYAQLDARSDAVARGLRARGVRRDERVGICMDRSIDMTVAVLAVLKAGGAYVPIDPEYPAARKRYMTDNAEIRTVVVTPRTRAALGDISGECVELPSLEVPSVAPLPDVEPDALAYVIYTSGSTGLPKGVAMPHAPLVNLVRWQRENSSAGLGTRTLQFASLSFDVSFQELFSTWCTGGTLVLVGEETRRDARALLRLMREERVERIFLPYVALQHMAEAASGEEPVRSLREIITAGEQLHVTPSIRAWMRTMPECSLVNQYGPTETHVVTSYTLRGAVDEWEELPPIGSPITGARVYILDAAGQPAAVGVRGEIVIGGDVLAREYLGASDKTAERFVRDPFVGMPGARMYRTGDLGRRRRDGAVQYLGRLDGQVKLRGYRIELGEVESVIARDPSVAACAATVREEAPGDRRLVAYVVPGARPVSVTALRDLCRAHLPEFMVPAAFVSLDALPLTPSGKIDRRALPAPAGADAPTRGFAAPVGEMETTVAAIWKELLRVERVGRDDDFFELGGHSLIATRMVSRLRDRLGCEVPLRVLFDYPILGEFAANLQRLASVQAARPHNDVIGRAAFRHRAADGGRA